MLKLSKKSNHYGVQIPLTSLIDIVFLLLIYFLLTTNFLVDEGLKINLPKAKTFSDAVETELVIQLHENGEIYLDQSIISTASLLTQLRNTVASGVEPVVIVKADKTVIVDRVVAVMDLARAAGVDTILLATERDF